jgi:hypothetical protein
MPHIKCQGAIGFGNHGAPLKVKLFMWLAARRHHWMADQRRRHGLDVHDTCCFCDQESKMIDHIVVHCSYSRQVRWYVHMALDETQHLLPTSSIVEWWEVWHMQWTEDCCRGSDSLFALIT